MHSATQATVATTPNAPAARFPQVIIVFVRLDSGHKHGFPLEWQDLQKKVLERRKCSAATDAVQAAFWHDVEAKETKIDWVAKKELIASESSKAITASIDTTHQMSE